jgi:hypothetical protein
LLKQLGERTLNGLVNLLDLKLSKSHDFEFLHPNCFNNSKQSLRELHLKDLPRFNLIENYIDKDKSLSPPFLAHLSYSFEPIWLQNLNLSLLNLENSLPNSIFSNQSFSQAPRLLCKALLYLKRNTLVQLARNQPCTCLVYLFYRDRHLFSDAYPRWEFKTPFCYRNQIIKQSFDNNENGTIFLFDTILKRETECGLDKLDEFCFPPPTTTTTTTTDSTTTQTLPPTTPCPTTPKPTTKLVTTRRTRPPKLLNPNQSLPINKTKKTGAFPKLDFKKFLQVLLTIALISVLSILFTCLALRVTSNMNKRKKELKAQQQQAKLRTSLSNTSSMNPSTPTVALKTQRTKSVVGQQQTANKAVAQTSKASPHEKASLLLSSENDSGKSNKN